MRFLLISDTHGKLGIINELARLFRADAVVHAGDFGFFDHGSFERLSYRELRLHVAHSDLLQTKKNQILALSRNNLIKAVREHHLLGGFQSYLDGVKSFQVTIYAVWGNHEDKDVVERLFSGDLTVENLHILNHRQSYQVGPAFVFGLGGNLLPGSKILVENTCGTPLIL